MATNPELEAAIEKDPDDEAAYLVYSDWLQTQDDPRGELIALQAATLRNPSDKEIAARVTELLARNDSALLGELGEHMSVVWQYGFVRDVKLAHDKNPDVPLAALRQLLEHPSGRFVRSIAFAKTKGVDAKKVVKLLLDEKRPLTLSELRIGGNFDLDTDAPELREVFPRLHRAVDLEWRSLLKVLSEQRAMDLKYDADKLPKLVPLPEVKADGIAPEHILLGLKVELEKNKKIGMLAALKRSFTPESLDAFVAALGKDFIDRGGPAAAKYGFQAIGALGGPLCIDWIAKSVGDWSHARAVQGAELIGQMGTNVAIWELYAMAADPALNRPRRDAAESELEAIARKRSLDVDRLLDRSIPPAMPQAAKKRGKSVPVDGWFRIRNALVRRFEAHMIDGRRIPHRDFIHYFASHPAVAGNASCVLWATYEGVDVETTFRLDGTRALDAGGDEVDLDGAMIGVVHPAELPADDRKSTLKEWGEVFSDEGITPLFVQLDRPVYELKDKERAETAIPRFTLRTVGFDHLRDKFENELDWAPIRDDDADGGAPTVAWRRNFPRDGVMAVANIGHGVIESVSVYRGASTVRFDSIHPVTASEILYACERATTRPGAAEVDTGAIQKGMWVQIHRGANRLREGVVFWLGDGNNGPRCGIRTDGNETLWANIADVRVTTKTEGDKDPVEEEQEEKEEEEDDEAARFIKAHTKPEPAKPAPAPLAKGTLTKGMQVTWTKGRLSGTGTVFWIGKNKFGDGMRAGVKDAETDETVWVDADDCKPTEV